MQTSSLITSAKANWSQELANNLNLIKEISFEMWVIAILTKKTKKNPTLF